MGKYIGKRIFYSLLTLWVLITVTFFMMHMLPGDPFIGDKPLPESTKAAMYARYGLDLPLWKQYFHYIMNALHGDLGESMVYKGQSITSMIAQAFPYSFDLGIRALIFGVTGGMLLGVTAALNRGRAWDTTAMILAGIGVSIPSFILGALLQYFVGVKLGAWTDARWGFRILPIGGWDGFRYTIMPAFVLGFGSLASIARMMRSSILEVSGMDYIKTARSKGLTKRRTVVFHMLRNAVSPVITIMGPMAASVLTGTFAVENIFNVPGMGKFFVSSIQSNDYTMIAGSTLFYGAFLIAANFLVDIAYMIVDPNVRLGKKED